MLSRNAVRMKPCMGKVTLIMNLSLSHYDYDVFSTYCTEDDTSRVSKRSRRIGSFAIGLYRNGVAEELKKSNQP